MRNDAYRRKPAQQVVPAPGEDIAPSVVVFGLISGEESVQALGSLLRALPRSFPAALLLVQHLPAHRFDDLLTWLQRRTRLQVSAVRDRDPALAGCVHVAPPDLHLAVRPSGRLRLVDGPPEHDRRPSANVLLRSLAAAGPRGAAVLLGGEAADGAAGVAALRAAGGFVLMRAGVSAPLLSLANDRAGPGGVEVAAGDILTERMLALAGWRARGENMAQR